MSQLFYYGRRNLSLFSGRLVLFICCHQFSVAVPESANVSDLSKKVMDDYCINLSRYYTTCKTGGPNPFQGAITFDNILLAWVAIFQVSREHKCTRDHKFTHSNPERSPLGFVSDHFAGRLGGYYVHSSRQPLFLRLFLLCSSYRCELMNPFL